MGDPFVTRMKILPLAFCFFLGEFCGAQQHKTENLIIVTLDGMRWWEIFGGIDSQIVVNKKFTRDSASVISAFGSSDRNERRKKQFPFLWNNIAVQGQIFGDRLGGSEVNNAMPTLAGLLGFHFISDQGKAEPIKSNFY